MNEYLQTRIDGLKEDQYYPMNEEIQHDGRAFYTFQTSFNRRNEHCKDPDLHEKSL
jgi:hypothetical protein